MLEFFVLITGRNSEANSQFYRVYQKKTEQIWNRSQRREAAQSMKFLINIDCLGTYDVE